MKIGQILQFVVFVALTAMMVNSSWAYVPKAINQSGSVAAGNLGSWVSDSILQDSGIPVTAAGTIDKGTTFTVSGSSAGTPVGGSATGTFVAGVSGNNTVVVTIGGGLTAGHGWACGDFADTTTNVDSQTWFMTGFTTTTVTLNGIAVQGDVIVFACRGFK